jgi:O-antigen/teichoic acid export membrane protein
MEQAPTIVRNTTIFFVAQVASYLLTLIYYIYMARYLGPDNFGILSFGLSLIGIFGIFTDLGLNTLMTREIARDKFKASKYFSNIISIKLLLALIIFTSSFLICFFYSGETIYVILILVLSLVFTTFSNSFYSLFQAYEKLKYQSFMTFFVSFLTLIGVLIAVFYKFNVIAFASIYLSVGIISLIYCLVIAYKNFILPKIIVNLNFWKKIIEVALGFGLISIFATVYVWIDSSMLFLFQGSEATGLYGAAYRIVLALLFIPTAINAAVFPVLSRLYENSEDSLKKIIERYFNYMLIVGVPLGVGGSLLAPNIIILFYGTDYVNSILSFQILIWATVFTFTNAAFVQFFQSTNRQLVVTKITGLWMIGNIVLNLILIPEYSYMGASISTAITELGVALLLIIVYNKTKYTFDKREFLIKLFKIIIASIIMGIFIWGFHFLNFFILIVLAIIIYLIVSYLFKIIDQDDIKIIKNIRN